MTGRAPGLLRRNRTLLLAAATTLVSDALLAATMFWANFAPGPWALAALMVVPLTLGLPTTLATLLIVSLWPGTHLGWLAAICCLAGGAMQFATFTLLARWRRRR